MSRYDVLVVDDDPGQRSLLTSFLHSQGFETLTAASGEQALEIADMLIRSGAIGLIVIGVAPGWLPLVWTALAGIGLGAALITIKLFK